MVTPSKGHVAVQFRLDDVDGAVDSGDTDDRGGIEKGLPMKANFAPSASAFMISVPRRNPPSIMTGAAPFRRSRLLAEPAQ